MSDEFDIISADDLPELTPSHERDTNKCDRCERDHDHLVTVNVGDEAAASLCRSCINFLWTYQIDDYIWYDSFTREHYYRIIDFLRAVDGVGCVIPDDSEQTKMYSGEVFVHTNYADTRLVHDMCDTFGGEIYGVHMTAPSNDCFDCVDEHGECVEIMLDFAQSGELVPPIERLDDFDPDDVPYLTDGFEPVTEASFDGNRWRDVCALDTNDFDY